MKLANLPGTIAYLVFGLFFSNTSRTSAPNFSEREPVLGQPVGVSPEVGHRLCVVGARVPSDLRGAFLPDLRPYRTRLDEDDVDAVRQQLPPQASRRCPRRRAWYPAYAPMKGRAILPPVEPTLRILPGSCALGLLAPRSGRKACVTEIKPTTLTSKCARTSSSGCSMSGPPMAVPALFTSPASPEPSRTSPTSSAAREHGLPVGDVEDERVKFAPNSARASPRPPPCARYRTRGTRAAELPRRTVADPGRNTRL